jgi:hypothetical protein
VVGADNGDRGQWRERTQVRWDGAGRSTSSGGGMRLQV